MLRRNHYALLGAALCACAHAAHASLVFDDVDVETWVGTGDQEALMIVDWQEDRTLAFGFRFSVLEAPTDLDMLEAIHDATDRFHRSWVDGFPEEAVYGMGWDADDDGFDVGDPDDWYEEGWLENGFWGQWVSDDGMAWDFSAGLGAQTLADGDWIGWSWAPDFVGAPPDVPLVPAPGALVGIVALLAAPRRRREVTR